MKEVSRLLRLFLPHWRWMLGGLAISVLTFLADVALMAVSGWFIASMAVAGLAGVSMNYFTPAAALRGLAISRAIGRYLERLVTHETTFRLLARLRVWLYNRIEPLAPSGLLPYRSGDMLSRLGGDIDALDHFYVRLLVPVATAVVGAAASVGYLSLYSPSVALSTFSLLLLAGAGVPLLVKRLGARAGGEMIEAKSRLRTEVVDGIQGMGEILLFGAAERQAKAVEEGTKRLLSLQARMSRLHGFSEGAVGLFANLALWCAIVLVIPVVRRGDLPPVDLALIALFTLTSFEAVSSLPGAFQMLGHTLGAARRVFTLADAGPMVQEPEVSCPKPEGCPIEIRNLSFAYVQGGPAVLKGVNLSIPTGKRLAVIGPTGSGKTTLAHLLMRFWEYGEGEITFGGSPLRSYRSPDIHRMAAVVSQDTHLFNTTIRENILMGNLHASEEEMISSARAARVHDFVLSLPEGYDTLVGEAGVKLSAGQARRLTIARALLKDAPLVILDEPTEGLDPETEREVMGALKVLMEGRTVLLITHRLVGLEDADEVIMLDGGEIVERGRHDALMKESARYARWHDLWSGNPF